MKVEARLKTNKSRRDLSHKFLEFLFMDFVDAQSLYVLREDSTNMTKTSTEEKQSNHRESLEVDAVGGTLEKYVHVFFC